LHLVFKKVEGLAAQIWVVTPCLRTPALRHYPQLLLSKNATTKFRLETEFGYETR